MTNSGARLALAISCRASSWRRRVTRSGRGRGRVGQRIKRRTARSAIGKRALHQGPPKRSYCERRRRIMAKSPSNSNPKFGILGGPDHRSGERHDRYEHSRRGLPVWEGPLSGNRNPSLGRSLPLPVLPIGDRGGVRHLCRFRQAELRCAKGGPDRHHLVAGCVTLLLFPLRHRAYLRVRALAERGSHSARHPG